MVALAGNWLVHVPPGTALDKVTTVPMQTGDGVAIGAGEALTVIARVTRHPFEAV